MPRRWVRSDVLFRLDKGIVQRQPRLFSAEKLLCCWFMISSRLVSLDPLKARWLGPSVRSCCSLHMRYLCLQVEQQLNRRSAAGSDPSRLSHQDSVPLPRIPQISMSSHVAKPKKVLEWPSSRRNCLAVAECREGVPEPLAPGACRAALSCVALSSWSQGSLASCRVACIHVSPWNP